MSEKITSLSEIHKRFIQDRPIMADNDSSLINVAHALVGEVLELLETNDRKQQLTEAADIYIYCLTIFELLGGDIETEVREKLARNALKHSAHFYQEGDYTIQSRKAKNAWREEKGEDWFYEIDR
jgi:NTP pyrophosphatase (non-canonical NTP hydrolase)